MLKQEYANWDIPLNADVCTATSFMDELVQQRKLKLSPAQGCVTYHDAARLSRDLQETEPARRLIQAMGYTIHEMWQSRDLTRSTGGEALVSYAPEIILKTAACRMEDAAGTNAEMLICACPASEANLDGIPGMPVADLFVLLDRQSTPQA